jgi:hypothetical protein
VIHFLLKLAYFTDILLKLNVLNKCLQKEKSHILTWEEKIRGLIKKLSLWEPALKKGPNRFSDLTEDSAKN